MGETREMIKRKIGWGKMTWQLLGIRNNLLSKNQPRLIPDLQIMRFDSFRSMIGMVRV